MSRPVLSSAAAEKAGPQACVDVVAIMIIVVLCDRAAKSWTRRCSRPTPLPLRLLISLTPAPPNSPPLPGLLCNAPRPSPDR